MSARSIISHRLFVAALAHEANSPGGRRPPAGYLPDTLARHTAPNHWVATENRAPSPRALAARRWLWLVINDRT